MPVRQQITGGDNGDVGDLEIVTTRVFQRLLGYRFKRPLSIIDKYRAKPDANVKLTSCARAVCMLTSLRHVCLGQRRCGYECSGKSYQITPHDGAFAIRSM